MAVLTVQSSALTGTELAAYASAAAGGDSFANDGTIMLHVKNGGGAPINVTAVAKTACNQGTLHDAVVSVTNGKEALIGPFPTSRFNDVNGKVSITYSAVTSVTVAVIKAG